MAYDVGHLEHRGADALRDQTAEFVFTVAHYGKADHLTATANSGGTCGNSRKAERNTDGGRADGKRQSHTHKNGNDYAHHHGMAFNAEVYERADPFHKGRDRRTQKNSHDGA